MKKVINGITIATFVLFGVWFIKEPSYEPVIGLLITAGTLISLFFSSRMRKIKKYIYTVNVRGRTEKELKDFMITLTRDYFEISGYKVPKWKSEWKNVIIESKTKIDHKDLYYYFRENVGGKVYYVEGEGKCFGLNSDEGPPKYI